MPKDFGSLLRYWRKESNDMTQTELADELKYELGGEHYNKSDVSKWEHGRIPNKYVVEALEKILNINDKVLLEAAGYTKIEVKEDEDRIQKQPDQRHYEHWARLGKLAEELRYGLDLYAGMTCRPSRFGGEVMGWHYVSEEVTFSAQNNPLWKYLLMHLDYEFQQPKFSTEIQNLQTHGAWKYQRDWITRIPEPIGDLQEKLWLVIERGTFKGTCAICKDWY